MEYILIANINSLHYQIAEDSGYVRTYQTYDAAREDAEDWAQGYPNFTYAIYAKCEAKKSLKQRFLEFFKPNITELQI